MLQVAGGIWLAILIPMALAMVLELAFVLLWLAMTVTTSILLWVGGILKSILCGQHPVTAIWLYSVFACIGAQLFNLPAMLLSVIFLGAIAATFSVWIYRMIRSYQDYSKPENREKRRALQSREEARKRQNAKLWSGA